MVASAAIWSPAAGLFSDAGATTAYVAGTRADLVWARPTPSGSLSLHRNGEQYDQLQCCSCNINGRRQMVITCSVQR
ncbi:MAG: hypothetical protein IPP81_04595 [Chitinophagaceae bacterium]|nr:hypothetical protein [Chitinophagaceae bacterium]